MKRETAAVLLCAGRSTRMGSSGNKVCARVAGRPALSRLIAACHAAGAHTAVVVHAPGDDKVRRIARGADPKCQFAVQDGPRGTGHAALVGLRRLKELGHDGPVMVMAADKAIDPRLLVRLSRTFQATRAACAFVVGPKLDNPGSGRIVTRADGSVAAVIEVPDIARCRAAAELAQLAHAHAAVSADRIRCVIRSHIPQAAKAKAAFPELTAALTASPKLTGRELARLTRNAPTEFSYNDGGRSVRLSPQQIEERTDWANVSIYLFRGSELARTLAELGTANAQGEAYLTDTVGLLAQDESAGPVVPVHTRHPHEAMGFNTPSELAAVRRAATGRGATVKVGPPRTVGQWVRALERADPRVYAGLSRCYGPDTPLIESRRRRFRQLLRMLPEEAGRRPAVLVRAPGRVNLMGRHIDHRGGANNSIAIQREVLMVAAPRDDGKLVLQSAEREFEESSLDLRRLAGRLGEGEWLDIVGGAPKVAGWGSYVAAAALRLTWEKEDIRGADVAVWGDLPRGAGLSSSSALTTAAFLAFCELRGTTISKRRAAELCGEAEWYVGTRGGMGDHAAILLCRRGKLRRFDFVPFRVGDFAPFPGDHTLMLAFSGEEARKSGPARNVFNSRVAAADIAMLLLRAAHPEFAGRLTHLRDVNPATLGVTAARIYNMLAELPEAATRSQLLDVLGRSALAPIFATHDAPRKGYPVRGVVAFVVAEAARADRCARLLQKGDSRAFGRMMCVSHDGDRVSATGRPWRADVSADALRKLGRARAPLWKLPGAYACSTERIDRIVDIALGQPGVVGAQICGGGLGGAAAIVVREDAAEPLRRALDDGFYRPARLQPQMLLCRPVAGAGTVRVK